MCAIGYFPTYTLGAIYAAQFMEAVRAELGGEAVDAMISAGELGPILQRRNVWENASIYETSELVKRIAGKPFDASGYRAYLERRYLTKE